MTDEQPSSPPPEDAKPKKRKKLTRKQAALARARVKDPEATLSELGVKSAYRGGPGTVQRELSKPHVRARIQDLMESHPETSIKGLHKKIVEGLGSTFVKVFKSEDDTIIESKAYDDMPTRHRYLETALELQGLKGKALQIDPDALPDGATFTLTITT